MGAKAKRYKSKEKKEPVLNLSINPSRAEVSYSIALQYAKQLQKLKKQKPQAENIRNQLMALGLPISKRDEFEFELRAIFIKDDISVRHKPNEIKIVQTERDYQVNVYDELGEFDFSETFKTEEEAWEFYDEIKQSTLAILKEIEGISSSPISGLNKEYLDSIVQNEMKE